MTPQEQLIAAVKAGNEDEVRQLLESRPELAHRQENGPSPVLLALYHRQPEIAAILVHAGAELDLHEAAAAGQLQRVRELVEADPTLANATAADGFHPLGLAAFFGRAPVAAFLLEQGASVSLAAANPQRVQPLHAAVAGGDAGIVRMLLEQGADPDARQQRDFTPLHGAAAAGRGDLVDMLLEYGADARLVDEEGRNAAELAREAGHDRLAERLAGL